ncbi:MAG: hypothetical protein JWM51_514 [Microbacteriaceae bacterium]|jgi:putative tricarboxylic transport membrane protein|nr:hypothetical protein [Microbacteriaceae bacterium]
MSSDVQYATGEAASPAERPRLSWGELAMALVLLALGVVVILDGLGQPQSTSASGIGAGLFPVIVGTVLCVVSVLLCIQVLRRKHGEPEDAEGDVDIAVFRWRQGALAIGAVIFFIVALEPIGYILTAAITFWLIAFAIGARHHARSGIIALLLAAAVYFLFTLVLRIDLPAGVFEGIL